LSEATRRDKLRRYHNKISAEMVDQSRRAAAPLIGLQLTEEYHPSRIADLCEPHTVDPIDLKEDYDRLTQDGPDLRMALLSGLLRVADILDESQQRAQLERARTLALDVTNQSHWWRHHYTAKVTVAQHEKEVRIWFDFPTSRREDYRRVVPLLQMPWIEREFGLHMGVFHRYRLGWTVRSVIMDRHRSDTDEMPDAVEAEMLKQLERQRREEERKHRQAALRSFAEAQPHIERRLRDLDSRQPEMASDAYLHQLSEIAQDLWDLGGRRSAWMMLRDRFTRSATTLEPAERLRIGVCLATMQVEDKDADGAARTLHDLVPLADHLPDGDPEKAAFWRLWARCLTEAGYYGDATTALERAAALCPPDATREELRAQLGELHLLQGDPDAALRVCDAHDDGAA
jgi:tetratricopeptide (TPR) repeat protein